MKKFAIIFVLILSTSITLFGKKYKGAEYRTHDSFTYGRFEVSYKPAFREGVISSFFTYHEITSSAEWNEIDIEFVGRYSNQMQYNTISPGQKNHKRNEYLAFNPYVDFHTYAFEWTPDYIAWFVDGVEVYRQTADFVQEIDNDQKIMMNIWNPVFTNWVGEWNDYSLPAYSYYDWVSYSSYTPDNGTSGTNNNFTLEWKDDFDSFDSTRWGKATHTFPGNQCDFVPENVVFEDGKMILCLTDENNLGKSDNSKPKTIFVKAQVDSSILVSFSEEMNTETTQNLANYNMSGVTFVDAIASEDKRFVKLITQNFDPSQVSNLIVLNVEDDDGNVISPAATTIIPYNTESFPLKINFGGTAVSDFIAAQDYKPDQTFGYLDGTDVDWPNVDIEGTDQDVIYLTDRQDVNSVRINAPNGNYDVTLMFAEKYWEESGKRIFDIIIEEELVQNDLDIFSEVGKNTAIDLVFNTDVNDGIIEIILSSEIDIALLSGIIIEQKSTSVNENEISPKGFGLFQNYPNPFNPETIISYTLPKGTVHNVKLNLFNSLGELVKVLINENQAQGNYQYKLNAENLTSGVYFYRLSAGTFTLTKKMLLLK